MATAVSGAAGGDATGSLSGLVQASAVNVLQGLATQQVKALADGLGGSTAENSAARAALQAVVGCAGQAAGGTGDCSAGAMGAASAVVLNQLLKSGPTPSTDKDGQPLSQSAGQARDALVSTLVAAVASGAGLDAASATVAARIETQNNATVTPLGRYGPDNKPGLPVADVYEHDPAFRAAVKALGGLEAYEAVTKCVRAGPFCPTTPAQQAALTAYSQGSDRLEGQARIDAWLCSGETPLLCGVQAVNAFNQTPLGVRLVGGMQALGGAGQAVSGTIMAYGGASTCVATAGAGCVVATLGGVNLGLGLDNARTGFLSLRDGTPSPTLGGRVISTVSGASLETSEAIYGQANLAVGLVTSGVTIGRGSVPAATSSAGAQGEKAVANALASAEMPETATTQAALEATLPKGETQVVLEKASTVATVEESLTKTPTRGKPLDSGSVSGGSVAWAQADLDAPFTTYGLEIDPMSIPQGQKLIQSIHLSNPSLDESLIRRYARDYIKSGSTIPNPVEIKSGVNLVKIVPKGQVPSPYTGYWMSSSELKALQNNNSEIGAKLGLPLGSQTGDYDIYQITAKSDVTVFESKVAPTQQGSVKQVGGATQTIVPNRKMFSDPVKIN
ncbi:hypothetical protein [Sphingomonas sp. SORGH_AS_0879]|uniref:hypothetical protein n=1 Tax=Sphingomonas sp. SORGH_AS_0879 TaxID=3041790 RepID=UPI0027D805B7|nr:hypothetical protein [Sphingomonas sp. SORGH_AS_0879]